MAKKSVTVISTTNGMQRSDGRRVKYINYICFMKISIPAFLLATVITLGACNNNETAEATTPLPPSPANTSLVDSPKIKNDSNTLSAPVLPGSVQQQPATGIVLNPPHGQPGHSCDVEVGQPLNGAPVSNSAPPVMTMPAQQPQALPQAPLPANGQVRINPAHGQPGHRCDVAVGAAL